MSRELPLQKALAGEIVVATRNGFLGILKIGGGNYPGPDEEMHSFIWNELNIKDIPTGKSGLIGSIGPVPSSVWCGKNTRAPSGGPLGKDDRRGHIPAKLWGDFSNQSGKMPTKYYFEGSHAFQSRGLGVACAIIKK